MDYNFLVIGPKPERVASTLETVVNANLAGKPNIGSANILSAKTFSQAEIYINRIFEQHPEDIIILLFSQQLSGIQAFTAKLGYAHPERRLASIVSNNVQNGRPYGIFRAVTEVTAKNMLMSVDQVVDDIFSRERGAGLALKEQVLIQLVTDPALLEKCLRLRFDDYHRTGRLVDANESGIDADAFDKSAYHMAVSYGQTGTVVATIRLITRQLVPSSRNLLEKIVERYNDQNLAEALTKDTDRFPTIEDITSGSNATAFEGFLNFANYNNCVELSRNLTHSNYRRMGLAGMVMAFSFAYLLETRVVGESDLRVIGSCDPGQFGFYAGYGATSEKELFDARGPGFISCAFRFEYNGLTTHLKDNIRRMRDQINRNGSFAIITPETQWHYRRQQPSA